MDRITVAGAGVFGVTAAIELRKRGHAVRLVDPGPLPHPLAASTDISKVVRPEYGADEGSRADRTRSSSASAGAPGCASAPRRLRDSRTDFVAIHGRRRVF